MGLGMSVVGSWVMADLRPTLRRRETQQNYCAVISIMARIKTYKKHRHPPSPEASSRLVVVRTRSHGNRL